MNNFVWIILSVLVITGGLTALFLALFNILKKQIAEDIKIRQEHYLQLSKKQFELEQSKAASELEARKQSVESTVQGLKEQLDKYQELIREFEKDRHIKYGNLENELKNTAQATGSLQDSTNRLNDILGNVKQRGQWGERMAEDVIQNSGLIEGINYVKQTKMDLNGTIPDYTFFLPNKHKVNMDVKFPFDNYRKMVEAQSPLEKENFEKDFINDVKTRMKELKDRGYINAQELTLDFVLLFIPNEQVFGIIQEKMPGIMDEALGQKIVLCSPFTLYAMLSVIRQAYENFRYEKDLKDIINNINQFAKYFEKFKERFTSIGSLIKKLDDTYDDVRSKNFKQLETKIRHIDECKKGNSLELNEAAPAIDISPKLTHSDDALQ